MIMNIINTKVIYIKYLKSVSSIILKSSYDNGPKRSFKSICIDERPSCTFYTEDYSSK